jgi:hypothetical protein
VANIIVAFEGWNSSTHGWGEGPWGEGEPSGISAQGEVGQVLVWGKIVPNQNPNWQNIQGSQTPNWSTINPNQTPDWQEVA